MPDHPAPAGQPNRLIHETSPYLLQHAYNPVDWYPWGPQALEHAASEDKPILLSVGYSACHWCHVMAHESFEDPETAAIMNELFVNIKVDREERPDIDAIYMEAVQAMTGGGGWPMTVFLTPEGKPFYGGTYFPPAPRYNMPGFPQLLAAISEAWQNRRKELLSAGERLADALNRTAQIEASETPLDEDLLRRATEKLTRSFDRVEGGFGGAPKFPQPMNLDFLLQRVAGPHPSTARLPAGSRSAQDAAVSDAGGNKHPERSAGRRLGGTESTPRTAQDAAPSKESLLHTVTFTLTKMARGGMYDQLGGGFHRYSTDAEWLVPHFEKMLYDNAQLARTYLHAWQLTGDPFFRCIVEETLDYVLREMTSPEGAFYSTQDADSESQEGKFFIWTQDELNRLLGPEDGKLAGGYWGVIQRGNWREGGAGANILHVSRPMDIVAADLSVETERLAQAVDRGRKVLLEAREERVHPGRDEKVLAEWNGLMLHALAEAGAVLGREDYLAAAERNAGFLLSEMREGSKEGLRLYRTWKSGEGAQRAKLNGYLEDYAAVALGLLALYQVTFELRWLQAAISLADEILDRFHDSRHGGFFQTASDHEKLVARRKDFVDSAVPAGNSLAAELLLRLAKLLDRPAYAGAAVGALRLMGDGMGEQPLAFGRLLSALDFHVHPGFEIAVMGERTQAAELLAEIWRRFLPTSIVAGGQADGETAEQIALLADRPLRDGKPTAYVCRNYACNLPVTSAEALVKQLDLHD
jgi:uncharacterized protein YyaL (SSP411 family)